MPYTATVRIALAAAAAEVFRALTEPALLERWLAARAEVDLDRGRYALWGRFLPGNPAEPCTSLDGFERDRSLRLRWKLFGHEGEVAITLEPGGSGTSLMVVHRYTPPAAGIHAGVADLWGLALENLRRLLAGGGGPLFADYSVPKSGGVAAEIEVDAPPHEVFRALTEPAELNRWIASDAVVEPRPGGRYDYGWGHCPIKVLDIAEDRRLQYSWQYGQEPETVVTWTLEGSGGRTRITLVHSGFAPGRPADDYHTGWLKFLNALKNMLEMGPAWRRAAVTDEEFNFVEG